MNRDVPAALHALMRMGAFIITRPLALHYPPARADAAVVLGAPPWADGTPTPLLLERLVAGAGLYHAGLVPRVLVKGGRMPGARHAEAEAVVMARHLEALGVPSAAILLEPRATTTAENARLSADLLLPAGQRDVWIVTQPFHLRRALLWFRRAGLAPRGLLFESEVLAARPLRALRFALGEYGALAALALAGAYTRCSTSDSSA